MGLWFLGPIELLKILPMIFFTSLPVHGDVPMYSGMRLRFIRLYMDKNA